MVKIASLPQLNKIVVILHNTQLIHFQFPVICDIEVLDC